MRVYVNEGVCRVLSPCVADALPGPRCPVGERLVVCSWSRLFRPINISSTQTMHFNQSNRNQNIEIEVCDWFVSPRLP